jgi:hypothetical protein
MKKPKRETREIRDKRFSVGQVVQLTIYKKVHPFCLIEEDVLLSDGYKKFSLYSFRCGANIGWWSSRDIEEFDGTI